MRATERIFSKWRNFSEATEASLGGISIRIKILRTPEEQAEGFMFKPEPEDGYGLFFVYKTPRPLSFWMRNVPYGLDLIALDDALCVKRLYTLRANEERSVEIEGGGRYALEMRTGWCRANGILVGDKLKVNEQ
jgi:uncharacterized membrane protein (UPF0127 family)